jgi:ribosomal protein S18 acetylase RimI-like enzyme
MQDPRRSLIYRPARTEDAGLVLALQRRSDIEDYGEPDSDLAELLQDWELVDLTVDTWLVFSKKGALVGYAAVIPRGSRLQHDFYTSPTWSGKALGLELLAWCEGRSRAHLARVRKDSWGSAVCYIAHVNKKHAQILRETGYSLEKYHFQMRMDLAGPLVEPVWPAGLSIRNVKPDGDMRTIHHLIQSAFARPGRTPQLFEEWEAHMARASDFDPGLWFLAFDGGNLVGACLCYAYEELGWVRQLGVAASWRRRGLGSALLRHAFITFKTLGFQEVGLGVEAANPAAYAFYQKIGMVRARQYDEFIKNFTHP